MGIDNKQLLAQIDAVLEFHKELGDAKDKETAEGFAQANQFITMALACIGRIAGPNSAYAQRANAAVNSPNWLGTVVAYVHGALQALRTDAAAGYLTDLQELIHANLFSDYLDMAEHLCAEGYIGSKDAAAVLAGGTLEEHLRQLCTKNNIPIEKSVEAMNTKLRAANVYGLNEQKQITAWYGVRTSAAHANYDEYSKERVELFIQWLRQFISMYPA